MISQLFLGIIAIVFLFMLVSRKRRKIWPLLSLAGVAALSFLFFSQTSLLPDLPLSYQWLAYKSFKARFIIASTPQLADDLRFLLPLLLGLLYLNLVYHREEHPLTAGNIMLLLLAAFIFMSSAQDFMQLMAGSCCFSILGFYLINDIEAKNKFIFYNFTAEMAVFTALAVVFAKNGNVNLSSLADFARHGWHRDLVALLLLVGVLIKCGMFLFQNQLLNLQKLGFNRMFAASLLAAPLSGWLIYYQLFPLLSASAYTRPVLYAILSLSVLSSLLGLLWQDNLKAKILYFNMLFGAFALFLLHQNAAALHTTVIPLLPLILLVDWCLMLPSISASDEIYVSQMGGIAGAAKYNLLLTVGTAAGFALVVLRLGSSWPFTAYLAAALAGLAANLHSIYLGRSFADEKVEALLCNCGWRYALPVLAALGWLIWQYPFVPSSAVVGAVAAFGFLLAVWPQRLSNWLADNETLQEQDWLDDFYRLFIVSPLHLLGRVLWLAVDFVVIERRVIGTVSNVSGYVSVVTEKLQAPSWRCWGLWLLLSLILLLTVWGAYAYE